MQGEPLCSPAKKQKGSVVMKRTISLILALIMCITAFAFTASAAEIKFNDVKETDWFYGDVMSAVEMGLINGKGEGVYAPNDNLTYAEAAKLAACMNQFYNEGTITLKNGTVNWYDTYVEYCTENGIIDKEYDYSAKATRAGYAGIFAKALPEDALKEVNNVPDNAIPDVPSSKEYAPGIYKLYRAGILQGSDDARNCKPLDNIKRSEVAAILTRMMDETKRVKFSMGEEEQKPEEQKPEETKPLAIKTQPATVTVNVGETAELKVEVEGGKAPYTYQWQKTVTITKSVTSDFVDEEGKYEGAKTNTFKITLASAGSIEAISCKITDAEGASVTTEKVKVTFNEKSTGGAKDKFEQGETIEDAEDKGFLMYAEDVFYLTDKGVLVNGRIIKGELKVGDAIKIISADGSETAASVARIEMFHKSLDEAEKGDNIGLLLNPEIAKGTVVRGDTLIGADADYTVTNTLIGTLTLLSTAEGGRESAISNSFSPQFSYGSHDTTGVITGLANGTMNPGETQENINVKFSNQKGVWYVGQTLDVLQAGRKLGTFTVTMIGSSSSSPSTVTKPSTATRPSTARPSTTTRPSIPTRPSTTIPSTSTTLAYKTQPASTTVNADEYATFTVEVTGGKAPYQYYWMAAPAVGRGQEYQWEYLGEDKAGADFIWSTSRNTLKVRPNKAGIIYYHSVVIDANGDSVVSNNVYLTAKAGNIHVEVSGTMSTYNDNDILALTANVYGGSGKYSYQWQCTSTLDEEDKWHNANYTTKTNKDNEPICYLDLDRVIGGKAENYYARVCVTDLETNKTAYSPYVRGIAVWGMDEFVISETKAIVLIKDRDKLAFEYGKEKTVELEVFGGKAPYTYRWEYSTDGTNFMSIPVEATWADSVAKPNLKVTYDGVGIIKGNYLRCKVTDANGNVFYCEPLKVIQHFDFT
ncbi:MAG: hypothetical protein E7583_04170 [Ruminococcaceae bacterium]|nr:hypothetical protein [Oscillospiraceae bacterium]